MTATSPDPCPPRPLARPRPRHTGSRTVGVILAAAAVFGTFAGVDSYVGAESDRVAVDLVTGPKQRSERAGAHVVFDDGHRVYINNWCRRRMADAGITARPVDAAELASHPRISGQERSSCEVLTNDLLTGHESTLVLHAVS
ncbi:MAG: hypothetical protein AAFP84_15035, partial [Actinomycetota bacterium]